MMYVMCMSTFGKVFLAILALWLAGMLAIAVQKFLRRREDARAPRQCETAFVSTLYRYPQGQCYATFRTESGKILEFELNLAEFSRLQADDQGRLTWQGSRFVSFEFC